MPPYNANFLREIPLKYDECNFLMYNKAGGKIPDQV